MTEHTNTNQAGATDAAGSAQAASAQAAPARPRRRRLWMFAGIAGATAALIGCAQPGAGAGEGWGGHRSGGHGWGHHHHRGGGSADPQEVARRIDKAVEWVLSDVGASAEQKAKVAAIAKQAAVDLAPVRDKHRAARRQAVDLLAAPSIDRAAIEQLRAEQIRGADEASKRLTGALTDIAEVLTPEQRVQLKARLEKRMGRHRS